MGRGEKRELVNRLTVLLPSSAEVAVSTWVSQPELERYASASSV